MLMHEKAKPGDKLGISLTRTGYQPPRYPSEATMVYDPIQHDGQTDYEWRAQEKHTRQYRPKRQFFRTIGTYARRATGLYSPNGGDTEIRYHESNKASRVRKIQKGIAVASLLATPLIVNKVAALTMWSDSHPQFSKVVEGVNTDEHCAMFEATGFGTRNSDETARKIGPATEHYGDVYSLQYDNSNFTVNPDHSNTVNTDAITDVAEKIIIENNYTCVSGFGSSFGGLVIADVMGQLAERMPDVRQDYEILDGMPASSSAVYDSELKRGVFLMTALTNPMLSWLNGVYARGAIEFFQRFDSMYQCDDGDILGDKCHVSIQGILWAKSEAIKRMTPEAASNDLLGAQYWSIIVSNFESSIAKVTHLPKANRPAIIYFRPADPTRDRTVKTELSQAQIGALTEKHGLEYVVVMLPEPAGHANPGGATDAYIDGFNQIREKIHPHHKYQNNPDTDSSNLFKNVALPPQIITITDTPGN